MASVYRMIHVVHGLILFADGNSCASERRRSQSNDVKRMIFPPSKNSNAQQPKKDFFIHPYRSTVCQALAIANGFADKIRKSNYTIWACSILPEHTHLVIARHTYNVDQIANLLKGAATSRILEENRHPLAEYAQKCERPPRMWAATQWKVFLDSDESIEDGIHYVEENPIKEFTPRQAWSFVTPFAGIPKSGWRTYH